MSMTTLFQALPISTELVVRGVETWFEVATQPDTTFHNFGEPYAETVYSIFEKSDSTLVIETEMSTGIRGEAGLTPYEEWLTYGNVGSYNDFLISIANLSTGAVWAGKEW